MPEVVELRVNGGSYRLSAEVGRTLAETLREDLGYTGTKVACGEGHCGACTVQLDGVPSLSCITLVHTVAGREVTTIEGLRDHPLVADDIPWNDREQVHAETVADWRAWLAAHHERPDGIWLVSWKASTGRPRMAYEASVEEALAFGWIDSKARTLDDERSAIWMSPRKPGSGWARPNKRRIERL